MAAPIEQEPKTPTSGKIPDFLDPLSPKFDPRRALYDSQTPIPVPDAKQFNNLAEFENYLEGKDAKTYQKKKAKPKEELPGIVAVRAAAQAKEAIRKAAIMAKNAGPSERSQTQERRNRSTTVFTRMENYKKGPLSVLRKCVEERLRVIVVIRAAVAVRSRCRGYVIGFDKHFNMALMDVDEKFIRPVPQKMNMKSKKATSSQESLLAEETDKLSVNSDVSRGCHGDRNSEIRQADLREGEKKIDLREKLKLSKASGGKYSSTKTSVSTETSSGRSSYKETFNRSFDSKDILERSRSKELKSSGSGFNKEGMCSRTKGVQENLSSDDSSDQRSSNKTLERSEVKRSRDFKDHYRNYMSDSNVFVKRQQEKLKDNGSKSDGESKPVSSDRRKKTGGDLKKHFQPFWPLYKKWTENRCYSEYEIVTRHVNQLFIRGDNVVSVSIADY
ncbi:U7 snRNA-associated Sm-like protein LSm11 isoform X2 [Ruditapes philippinarum]|uniref:U7 snRNA-associated Sm-like protein LSm11 isoform X2 n=1 Tax=Ruditapes philippinarum TaxID=129788 RepID=UPI00295A5D8A|nr:U7 snRNA-associated Sm-like protein LSm11 isoform X2 [Ruditapes philippinarum]